MKKKIIAILTILIVGIGVIFNSNTVYASMQGSQITDLFDGEYNNSVKADAGEDIIADVIGIILSVVRIVAVSLSVIILTFLGIKYMSAAPSEKAEIKRQLITFTIGVVVFISSVQIIAMVRNYAKSFQIT